MLYHKYIGATQNIRKISSFVIQKLKLFQLFQFLRFYRISLDTVSS